MQLIMLKRLIYAIAYFLLLPSQTVLAQYSAKSSTQPLALRAGFAYVVLPTSEFNVSHVKTKRAIAQGEEFLDFINVILPESFVLQKLTASRDIGATGLFVHDELLVTMAVLPDRNTHKVEWVEMKSDTLSSNRQVSWPEVANDCYSRLFNYKAVGGPEVDFSRRRTDLRPVIKRGTHYFTTKQSVLTEYYVLRNYPTWYPTAGDNATINCLARVFTRSDYAKELEVSLASAPPGQPAPRLRAELGTKLLLQKIDKGIYTFWSLLPTIADAGVAGFGAGDLRFKPGIGLISGKYAAYFDPPQGSKTDDFFDVLSIQQLTVK